MKDKRYELERWKKMMCGKIIIDICLEEPHYFGCNGCRYFWDSDMIGDCEEGEED